MTEPLYAGEAWCKSWADGSTSGRVVTFQIEEGGEHQFRGYEGQRFQIVVVPIGNDDQPIRIERKAKKSNRGVSGAATAQPSCTVKTGDAALRESGALPDNRVATQPAGTQPSPVAKSPRKWADLPPSSRAALLCKEPEFWAYLALARELRPDGALNETAGMSVEEAEEELKTRLGVTKKRHIDNSVRAAAELSRIHGNYRAWQTAKGHGVA